MEVIKMAKIERTYKNNGQHAEQVFCFTLTGELKKADNRPAEECGDILDIQIKSARATVAHGENIHEYLAKDKALRYAYVTADFEKAYIMDKKEWEIFCERFARKTYDSRKNGNSVKMRLPIENKEIKTYLSMR